MTLTSIIEVVVILAASSGQFASLRSGLSAAINTVTMGIRARLSSTQLTLLSRLSATHRTSDGEYLFRAGIILEHHFSSISRVESSLRSSFL
jgi:hypothetical protein